jgi:hypothetical protein
MNIFLIGCLFGGTSAIVCRWSWLRLKGDKQLYAVLVTACLSLTPHLYVSIVDDPFTGASLDRLFFAGWLIPMTAGFIVYMLTSTPQDKSASRTAAPSQSKPASPGKLDGQPVQQEGSQ